MSISHILINHQNTEYIYSILDSYPMPTKSERCNDDMVLITLYSPSSSDNFLPIPWLKLIFLLHQIERWLICLERPKTVIRFHQPLHCFFDTRNLLKPRRTALCRSVGDCFLSNIQ